MKEEQEVVIGLLHDSLLGRCKRESLARLLPHVSMRRLEKGERLYHQGEPATQLYLLEEGAVQLSLPEGLRLTVLAGRFGAECVAQKEYVTSATVVSPGRALVLPVQDLKLTLSENPFLKAELSADLLRLFSGKPTPAPSPRVDEVEPVGRKHFVGWALTATVPLLLTKVAVQLGMERSASLFVSILSATTLMWVFNLAEEYIPVVFSLSAALLLGLLPSETLLSGFVSEPFFEAMSVLALSVVVVGSGLSFRVLLWLLQRFPAGLNGADMALLLLGMGLTCLVPSNTTRAMLVVPLLSDLVAALGVRAGGVAATRLTASAVGGISLLSSVFLSGKSANYVIRGLFPSQVQLEFGWLNWLMGASVTGGVLLGAHLLASRLFFRSEEMAAIPRERLVAQLSLLGPMKHSEWFAVVSIVLFLLGNCTASVTGLAVSWLGMTLLCALLLFGVLETADFRQKVDWTALLSLAGMNGLMTAFNKLGLGVGLGGRLTVIAGFGMNHFVLFVLGLSGIVFLFRWVVPPSLIATSLAVVLIPIGEANGINPWVIGFVLLTVSEVWVVPYQSRFYAFFREPPAEGLYDERRLLAHNAVLSVARVLSLCASIPYWKVLGLL